MKKLKVLAFIVGFIMIIFGFTGFLSSFAYATTTGNGRLASALPINEVNGIAVDSKGQIYIGDGQSSSIQVFSNSGEFIYGFTFPTGGAGWFAFGIDDQDIIHIVTARTDSYFQYLDGECINTETIDYLRQSKLEETYNMSEGNYFKVKGMEYYLSSRNQVMIINYPSNTKYTITLNTPFWPLPIFIYWLIGAIGIGLWLYSFAWKTIINNSKLFQKQ